jgi:multiple sugar transport system substrate-binding protein
VPIDLYIAPHFGLSKYVQLGLAEDMESLMKKHGFDANRINPVVIQTLKANSTDGKQLVALPFYQQFTALYYNKDIFNTLGVPYPQDGLTWDDTLQLAKRVTRSLNGVNYYGFKPDSIQRMAEQFGLTQVDAKTNKASVNTENYRRVFALSHEFFSIPGNLPKSLSDVNANPLNMFIKDQNLSTYYAVNRLPNLKDSNVNWDMAQAPFFSERPDVGSIVDTWIIGVSKASAHKDDAFRVVETLLSDEVALKAARTLGFVSPLVNPALKEQFGAELDYLKGKNTKVIFKSKSIAHDPHNVYRDIVGAEKIMFDEHAKYIMGEQDLNTALRRADELINAKMAEVLAR